MQRHIINALIIFVALGLLGIGVVDLWPRPTSDETQTAATCQSTDSTSVVSVFLRPSTSYNQVSHIVARSAGTVSERYPSLHGETIVVPQEASASILRELRSHPGVVSANLTPTESCFDTD